MEFKGLEHEIMNQSYAEAIEEFKELCSYLRDSEIFGKIASEKVSSIKIPESSNSNILLSCPVIFDPDRIEDGLKKRAEDIAQLKSKELLKKISEVDNIVGGLGNYSSSNITKGVAK